MWQPNHLCRYHGVSIFKGLVTATNNYGEIRVQFHVVTDGQDQTESAIKEMRATLAAYGQKMTTRITSDKPAEEKAFFLRVMPELQIIQDDLNAAVPRPPTGDAAYFDIDLSRVSVGKSALQINTLVEHVRSLALMQHADKQVVCLDCEWDVFKGRSGHIVGQGKVALLQLGFCEEGRPIAEAEAILLRLSGHRALPAALLALFADPKYVFVGRAIAGDLAKLAKDFNHPAQLQLVQSIDLGPYARRRDVVSVGTAGLELLAELTLGQRLSKDPAVRLSQWSTPELTEAQRKYAALDVTVGLEVFFNLSARPDLAAKLPRSEAVCGQKVP